MARIIVKTKIQIEAIAWYLYVGGGTFDTADLQSVLDDSYRQGWEISEDIKPKIIARIQEIDWNHKEKANRLFKKAFHLNDAT